MKDNKPTKPKLFVLKKPLQQLSTNQGETNDNKDTNVFNTSMRSHHENFTPLSTSRRLIPAIGDNYNFSQGPEHNSSMTQGDYELESSRNHNQIILNDNSLHTNNLTDGIDEHIPSTNRHCLTTHPNNNLEPSINTPKANITITLTNGNPIGTTINNGECCNNNNNNTVPQTLLDDLKSKSEIQTLNPISLIASSNKPNHNIEEKMNIITTEGNDGNINKKTLDTCRICLDTENELQTDNKLLSPCKCTGSIKYVHQKCIVKWIVAGATPLDQAKCELCSTKFLIDFEEKFYSCTKKKFTKKEYRGLAFVVILILFLYGLLHLMIIMILQIHDSLDSTADEKSKYLVFKWIVVCICGFFCILLLVSIFFLIKKYFKALKSVQWIVLEYSEKSTRRIQRNQKAKRIISSINSRGEEIFDIEYVS